MLPTDLTLENTKYKDNKMKNIFLSVIVVFLMSNVGNCQDFKFKAVKPCSVLKGSAVYVGETSCKILKGAKDIVTAPFTTPVPMPEVKYYKYTFPKFKFEFKKGRLQELKKVPFWKKQLDQEQQIPELEIYDGEEYHYPLHYDNPSGLNEIVLFKW